MQKKCHMAYDIWQFLSWGSRNILVTRVRSEIGNQNWVADMSVTEGIESSPFIYINKRYSARNVQEDARKIDEGCGARSRAMRWQLRLAITSNERPGLGLFFDVFR